MPFFDVIFIYHQINSFLATDGGFLLRRSAEFVLLLIVTYMIFSEWNRERISQLKYLLVGFAILTIEKLILSIVGVGIVFGNIPIEILGSPVVLAASLLEIVGLIFVANAFLHNLFEKSSLKKLWISELVLFVALALVTPLASFTIPLYIPFVVLEVFKVGVLFFAISLIITKKKFDKINTNVIIAFAVYSISPLITTINILFIPDGRLRIVAHPFPFIAVLLLTRVVYLKLVDKVKLKEELVTTKKKYEQEKEVSAMKDEFVSVVSHELRTPLTSMKLYLSLLLEGKLGSLKEKQQETLSVVKGEVDRLSMLINDILLLSKLEHAKPKPNMQEVRLDRLINSLGWQSLAQDKRIQIIDKIPKNFIVNVDPDRFKQIFLNLVSNAIKFTDQEGWVKIEAQQKESNWVFSVSDSGKGITKEHHSRLFEKFYQSDDHLTRSQGGTGLGLAIVKKIVDMHGGSITVDSTPGKGSTFTVEFPN